MEASKPLQTSEMWRVSSLLLTSSGPAAGDVVDVWSTFNEPFVMAAKGWLEGSWPPGKSGEAWQFWAVLCRLMQTHRDAYDLLHATDTVDADGDGQAARVSLAHNVNWYTPRSYWNVIDPLMAAGAPSCGLAPTPGRLASSVAPTGRLPSTGCPV